LICRKHISFLIGLSTFFLLLACQKTDSQQPNSVTIIVDSSTEFTENKSIYISGNFEGWTGGHELYKLAEVNDQFSITLEESQEQLDYKFTLGNWNTVEVSSEGNDITNRTYVFSKPKDTLKLVVENWKGLGSEKELVLPENVEILGDSVYMPQLDRFRRVWVYTPTTYATSSAFYPVVYMHDAQNLFMNETSYAGEWQIDETLDWLQTINGLEAIVVGIEHGNEKRIAEMSPWANKRVENPEGDAYLNFITQTLKPNIDSTYRTKPDKTNTAIIGSSLGGLISFYAGVKHEDVFGKVGVFSPSFWLTDSIYKFAETHTKGIESKFYFLAGDQESEHMVSNMRKMESVLLNNGIDSKHISSKVIEGGQHNEKLWKNEFAEAISWLLNKPLPKERSQYAEYNEVKDAALASGTLLRIDAMASKYITPRPVDIWLPYNYEDVRLSAVEASNTQGNRKKFRVLYMHDGQMLFDANTTWNMQEWQVDEWMTKLSKEKGINDVIIVGIHNIAEERWQDLYPQKSFYYLPDKDQQNVNDISGSRGYVLNGDNYLRFITKELKPYIDSSFSTFSDRDNTYVMGSSMGGLMSMYAYSEYPEVFSRAACLSTHWVGAQPKDDNPFPEAIFAYMDKNLPESGDNKIYFDYGDQTLDAHYPQYAPRVDAILKQKGYTDENSKNLFFEGTNHSENAWNKRLDKPLLFLLGDN